MMKAEDLWKELSYLFKTCDDSLSEIRLTNLSSDGVAAIFSYLQHSCRRISNESTFWNIEAQKSETITSVPNAAALVVEGCAEAFHCLCQGPTHKQIVIPDLGVFVFDDQINLDYRMGEEWDATKLEALFGILREVKRIDPACKVTIGDYALRRVRLHFEATWERFLQATTAI